MYSTSGSSSEKNNEEASFSVELDVKKSFDKKNLALNSDNDRFPFCIVWTTLPLISQLIPIIGHTGVCNSEGIIHDFAGPYTVNEDDFAFGKTLKYVKLDNKIYSDQEWDQCLEKADEKYRQMIHNLCCNNCHSHVACFLNEIGYKGKKNWNMISVWWMCLVNSNYVKVRYMLNVYFVFILIAGFFLIRYFI